MVWSHCPGPSAVGKETKTGQAVGAATMPGTGPASRRDASLCPCWTMQRGICFTREVNLSDWIHESDRATRGRRFTSRYVVSPLLGGACGKNGCVAQTAPAGSVCAALVVQYVAGSNLFVPLRFGKTMLRAPLDPGSAGTLLTRARFSPETLPDSVSEITPGTGFPGRPLWT